MVKRGILSYLKRIKGEISPFSSSKVFLAQWYIIRNVRHLKFHRGISLSISNQDPIEYQPCKTSRAVDWGHRRRTAKRCWRLLEEMLKMMLIFYAEEMLKTFWTDFLCWRDVEEMLNWCWRDVEDFRKSSHAFHGSLRAVRNYLPVNVDSGRTTWDVWRNDEVSPPHLDKSWNLKWYPESWNDKSWNDEVSHPRCGPSSGRRGCFV